MKERLYEICENILEDETESKKFAKIKTVDELYEYLSEKVPDLSEEEFEDFIVEMLGYAEESYQNSQKTAGPIDDDALDSVAGGVNLGTKIVSAGLALMSFFPAVGATNKKANDLGSSAGTSISQKVDNDNEDVNWNVPSKWEKVKNWAKKHKTGLIVAGVAVGAAVAGGVAYKLHRDKKQRELEHEKMAGRIAEARAQAQKDNLMESARSGNVEALEKILQSDKNLSKILKDDALLGACKNNQKEAALLLIRNGANVNAKDGFLINGKTVGGHTPLYYALSSKYYEVAELLLSDGADVGEEEKKMAAEDMKMLNLFKKHGISIELSVTEGNFNKVFSADDVAEFKSLFKKSKMGINDAFDKHTGETLLHIAVRHESHKIVKYLAENKADLNKTAGFSDTWIDTALSDAVKKGNEGITKILLDHGADPNINIRNMGIEGNKTLDIAFAKGNEKIIDMLIAKGAKVSSTLQQRDMFKKAISTGDHAMQKKLLKAGIALDTGWRGDLEDVKAEQVISSGDVYIVKELVSKGMDVNHNNMLVHAVKSNKTEIVKFLLESGKLDMDYYSRHGDELLKAAFGTGNEEVINPILNLFVSGKASIREDRWSTQSLGVWLYKNGQKDRLRAMINKGVIKNFDQLVLYVASRGDNEMIKLLIDKGADMGKTYSGGYTIIHTALGHSMHFGGSHESTAKLIVDKLIEKGDKKALVTFVDQTIGLSGMKGSEIMPYLLDKCKNISEIQNKKGDLLRAASCARNVDLVRYLLGEGVNPESSNALETMLQEKQGNDESTAKIIDMLLKSGKISKTSDNSVLALQTACLNINGDYSILNKLLDYGIDVNKAPSKGHSVLCELAESAVSGHSLSVLDYLVENKGADINKASVDGTTPLLAAASVKTYEYVSNDKYKVIADLLAKGADQSVKDKQGRTAIMIVAEKNDTKSLEKLLNDKNLKKETLGYSINHLGNSVTRGTENMLREKLKTM